MSLRRKSNSTLWTCCLTLCNEIDFKYGLSDGTLRVGQINQCKLVICRLSLRLSGHTWYSKGHTEHGHCQVSDRTNISCAAFMCSRTTPSRSRLTLMSHLKGFAQCKNLRYTHCVDQCLLDRRTSPRIPKPTVTLQFPEKDFSPQGEFPGKACVRIRTHNDRVRHSLQTQRSLMAAWCGLCIDRGRTRKWAIPSRSLACCVVPKH